MRRQNYNVVGYDSRYWRVLAVVGIFFICLGIWIIFTSEQSYIFLSRLLAIGMLASGLFEAVFSLLQNHKIKGWGWIFAGGCIDTFFGIYVLNFPLLSLLLMPLIIGVWMLIRGFMTVSSHLVLKILGVSDWIWLVITSLILILPSLIILINPIVGLVNVVVVTGISFILSGVFRVYFSRQLKNYWQIG
ncbi:DUF308 domain-containing protein [Pedobacter sp. Du54]|uniref:HdeD family acid-resistance protein n=1 Tax=Pedobacter anseongensis TaxID=3133439 RepID=UPI0030A926D9